MASVPLYISLIPSDSIVSKCAGAIKCVGGFALRANSGVRHRFVFRAEKVCNLRQDPLGSSSQQVNSGVKMTDRSRPALDQHPHVPPYIDLLEP